MRPDDIEDLTHFLEELNRETDRGLPLVAAALIDERLEETLRSFFCEGRTATKLLDEANAPLGNFAARSHACFALALVDEFEYSEIELIRKIRNVFAHAKHGMSFRNEKVKALCSSLRSNLPGGAGYDLSDPRLRFVNAAVCIVLRLYYRPEWVARERRQPKSWVPEGASRWISVDDEKPPAGVPVIAVAKGPNAKSKR